MTFLDLGWFGSTVLAGSLLIALPVAMVGGLVSFFSPCVVPLPPRSWAGSFQAPV